MNIADKVNDEPQCLSLRVLVSTCLEYVYVVLQGRDNVRRGQGRELCSIERKRCVDKVKLQRPLKGRDRSKVVRPVCGINKVWAVLCNIGRVY